jgi:uncharacterized membrane-anchored protein
MNSTLSPTAPQRQAASMHNHTPAPGSGLYLRLLLWAFTLFNFARVVTYLPTMHALQVSGDSSQHSLWTWCTWLGANISMAAWLYEKEGRRFNGPAIVSTGNAVMCAITTAQIIALRLWG